MTSERWKARLRLFRKSDAFKACFCEDGEISRDGARVLRDLAEFCHQDRSTLKVSPTTRQVDPLAMAAAEGRRDVFRRIVAFIDLDPTRHPSLKEEPDDD
ncbi:MAG: hypothetical protein KA191_18090 [Verrucomicrobia bacterium]|jgi:hypothetical protein|nr:hypothetical protein [Verrucomicrobiota bacterium]